MMLILISGKITYILDHYTSCPMICMTSESVMMSHCECHVHMLMLLDITLGFTLLIVMGSRKTLQELLVITILSFYPYSCCDIGLENMLMLYWKIFCHNDNIEITFSFLLQANSSRRRLM